MYGSHSLGGAGRVCGGRGERFQVADRRGLRRGVGVGVGTVVVGLALAPWVFCRAWPAWSNAKSS